MGNDFVKESAGRQFWEGFRGCLTTSLRMPFLDICDPSFNLSTSSSPPSYLAYCRTY